MNNWYNKTKKQASESVSLVDANIQAGDVSGVRDLKQWAPGSNQGLGGESLIGLGLDSPSASRHGKYGTEVSNCGAEPGHRGGCGKDLEEYGAWHNYSVDVDGQRHRAYKCKNCGHSLKPFNIDYTKKKKKKKTKRRSVSRLSSRLTLRTVESQATPGSAMSGGGYNNPANTPLGRLDLSEDSRVIPWSKVKEDYESEYDSQKQKNNGKSKVVKVKNKKGEDKYIRVTNMDGSPSGILPANTYNQKGKMKQQLRYNPPAGKDKNDGHGSWPHNRDSNKGWYQSPQSNNLDTDLRERAIPWSKYIKERNTNLMTLTKPM